MQDQRFDIIIPTYGPGADFEKLLDRIADQTVLPGKIIIINTDVRLWKASPAAKAAGERGLKIEIYHINKDEFNHGTSRNEALKYSDSEYFVCMTQDAVPYDERLFENMLKAFSDDAEIKAVYARQVANENSGEIEKITRKFNYPEESRIKTADDIPLLGIKTFFCSNVCAAYERKTFEELGRFVSTDFNEDMIYAFAVIKNGYKIKYCADALVIHSHDYSGAEQFRRNKLLGKSQGEHPEVFGGIRSEGEGLNLVKTVSEELIKRGKFYLIPKLIYQSACKYAGYRMGKNIK